MHPPDPIALTTRGGVSLLVRPAGAEDEPALAAFFDRVSDEDRRFRFLTAAEHVDHAQLLPLVTSDHYRSESFLAFDRANGELVASALLACNSDFTLGEVAISVRANYRGHGVGWALLDLLGEEARKRGVRKVIAIEARENHAAIELERQRGFEPQPFEDDPTLVLLTKTF